MSEKHERNYNIHNFALAFHSARHSTIPYWPDLSDQVEIQLVHVVYLTNLAYEHLESLRDRKPCTTLDDLAQDKTESLLQIKKN